MKYETAKELKELGAEQTMNDGDWYWHIPRRDDETKPYLACERCCYPNPHREYCKAHSTDQLKAAIHAAGYEVIKVTSWQGSSKDIHESQVECKGFKKEIIETSTPTEDDTLAAGLIQILKAKKPRTCGECMRPICDYDDTRRVCLRHPKVEHELQLAWFAFNSDEACPNFKEA